MLIWCQIGAASVKNDEQRKKSKKKKEPKTRKQRKIELEERDVCSGGLFKGRSPPPARAVGPSTLTSCKGDVCWWSDYLPPPSEDYLSQVQVQ